MYRVCRPFVRFLAFSTNLVLKLFGIGAENEEEPVDEEDILMMASHFGPYWPSPAFLLET